MLVNPGLVVASSGRHLVVQDVLGRRWMCHLRGRSTEAVVGDRVNWSPSGDGGVIESVLARRSLIKRQDAHRSKAFAANVDALLFVVAVQPTLSESLLSRALLAAHDAGVAVTIVLNKVDLPGVEQARAELAPYVAMGYALLELSVRAPLGHSLEALGAVLSGKTSLLLGASGVGKSSLLNLLVPDAQARTAEISRVLHKGRHTTTRTTWHAWPGAPDSALIDSPGFQAFGLDHLEADALATAMPDLATWLGRCRFSNCSHLREPDCPVRQAADRGEITATRWRIYREIRDELSRRRI